MISNFLHGLLSNKNRRIPIKNKFRPLGADFSFFFLSENRRRRLAIVLKLHKGFILTKKGDNNPKQNLGTNPGPLGAFSMFFYLFF